MISHITYKIITDILNAVQDEGEDIVYHINNMNVDLSNSDINEESFHRIRLSEQITSTYNVLDIRHNSYTSFMLDFVRELQKYVDETYSSVNDFLFDNNIQVKTIFALMSEIVGYPIDIENIEEEENPSGFMCFKFLVGDVYYVFSIGTFSLTKVGDIYSIGSLGLVVGEHY